MEKSVRTESFMKRIAVLLACLLVIGCLPVGMMTEYGEAFAEREDETEYRFGTLEEYSTYAEHEILTDSYYFSDSWFFNDPEKRNDGLAMASMQLVAASIGSGEDERGAQFLKKLGFSDFQFVNFDDETKKSQPYTVAKKTVKKGSEECTLVAVVIESYSFDGDVKEEAWTQNFTVNGEGPGESEGEHYSYKKVADSMIDGVAAAAGSGDVKYWITGQSRSGALASMLAVRLKDRLGASNKGIYAYTFETPAVVDAETIQGRESEYNYIHNYICHDDIVTMVPPWDMTRYGETVDYNTEESAASMIEELKKLGSKEADDEVLNDDDETAMIEETASKIISVLEDRIDSRAGYSEQHQDKIQLKNDEITAEYSYQGTLAHIMSAVFSGNFSGISLDRLSEKATQLIPAANSYIQGRKAEVKGEDFSVYAPYYWKAGSGIYKVLSELAEGKDLGITDVDLYVALWLLAPAVIDDEYTPQSEDPLSNIMGYFSPGIGLAMNGKAVTLPHHFDANLARLKTFASAPVLPKTGIAVTEPKAGDDINILPAEVAANAVKKDAADNTWMTAEAKWVTEDKELKDNEQYYLEVTFRIAGHTVTDEALITIGGKAPEGKFTMSHKDGMDEITGVWAYTIGTPEKYTVTFDAAGHGEAPDAMSLNKGSLLKYVPAAEVKNVETGWKFNGWYDDEGKPWDEIALDKDLTVHAAWKTVVDCVDISYTEPKLGDRAPAPSVSPDAPYEIDESMLEKDWDTVKKVDGAGKYIMIAYVVIKDPDSAEFLLDEETYDYHDYIGKATINGEDLSGKTDKQGLPILTYNYDDYDKRLRVEYTFYVDRDKQPMKVKQTKKTLSAKASVLKKKAVSFAGSKYVKVTDAEGAVTYKKASVSNKKQAGKFTVNKKNGKITLKKGLKKGTYKLKIKISASGNASYEAGSKTITETIKVK